MSQPRRVLYVVTTLAVGGAERSLAEILAKIDRTHVEPLVCTLISGGSLRASLAAQRVPVVELGVAAGRAELYGLRIIPILARFRPHLIHSRLILSNLWARLGRISGAPVLNEERGLAEDRPAWMTAANRWTERLATVHVANSEAVAERMRDRDRIAPDRIRVIHGGVDVARFAPDAARQREADIICVTRLERYKGIFDLLDALALLARRRPAIRCLVVGDGSERAEVERRTRTLGLDAVVRLVGQRSDVPSLLRAGRLFVLPSHEEGLPNAIMEAMASGLPVVATAVGGTRELVVDGQTGQLVEPRDPNALAAALDAYLEDEALARGHGAAARARACERFSIERSVANYLALYEELWR